MARNYIYARTEFETLVDTYFKENENPNKHGAKLNQKNILKELETRFEQFISTLKANDGTAAEVLNSLNKPFK